MGLSRFSILYLVAATLLPPVVIANEDIAAARQRFAKLLAAQTQHEAEPASVPIAWASQESVQPDYYLVSSPNCGACPAAKRNATAAGIDYKVISVSKARSLGLMSKTERALVPQLICSANPANRIVGAHAASKMKSWAATFAVNEPVVTATVVGSPSVEVLVQCLTAHLSGGNELPVASRSSILRKTVVTPAFVTRMISQLMAGETIAVADTGATVTWSGTGRTIKFASTDRIVISPPMTVQLRKMGIALTTTLKSFTINQAGAGTEIRLGLKGPDFTIRFVNAQ